MSPLELSAFVSCLRGEGLHAALLHLNRRTSHRYTGVFRFDGDMLRCVRMVDKWDAGVTGRADVPMAEAYCAHVHRTGEAVRVDHGPTDPRFPWMASSPFLSYCGAVICAPGGAHWGALCHFDTSPCEAKDSDMPLVVEAARLLYAAAVREEAATGARRSADS